jgi:SAM-dependent methyltransferase
VTRWLSERFKRVSACDISASHIDIARRYMRGAGRSNVDFRLIAELDEIEHLPATDFFYTMIVLQHNPPPLIEVIIRGLAGALKPGGYGLFQVPTHRSNYRFSVEEYLASLSNLGMPHHIEMHIMPMDRVFSIIHEAGCIPVQVFEDDWAGPGYESFSFLIHKPEKPG